MALDEPELLSLPGVSRRYFLALGGLTTAAAVTGWGSAAPAFATMAQVDLDFENGTLGDPITRSKGATVASAYAHSGRYGCRLDPTKTSDHVAALEINQRGFALNKPYATYSMYFRLVSLPKSTDPYMNLFEIGSTSTSSTKSQFTVYFKNNRLTCDFNYDETMDIGPVPAVGGWHSIQVVVNLGGTTYTAKVSYDHGATKTLTSQQDKVTESVKALWIHYQGVSVDYIMDVDDIQMATSDTEPGFFEASTLPAATANFGESFERGAVGAQPTSANTSYDQSIGDRGDGNGTIAVAFAADGVRGHCARFYNTRVAKGSFGFLGKRVGSSRILYLRRYYKLDRLPAYRMSVLLYKWGGSDNGQLGGTHNGSFAFGGTGQSHKFTLVNKDSNATVSKAVVPLNAWFRVEAKLDFTSGTGVQTVRLFLGANLHGTTPTETLQANLAGSYTGYIEDGILTNPNVKVNVRIDEAANDTSWLGPI